MEPIPLYISFSKYLGPEFITWDPMSRKMAFEKKSGQRLTEESHNMLEAVVTLNVSNIAWDDSRIFEKIVWALNGHIPNMVSMEVPPPQYIAYAIIIMSAINSNESLSDEIKRYIAAVLLDEGIIYAIDPFSWVQEHLTEYTDPSLVKSVEEQWKKIKDTNLSELNPNINDPVSTQMSKLAVIKLYLDRKEAKIKEELK